MGNIETKLPSRPDAFTYLEAGRMVYRDNREVVNLKLVNDFGMLS